MAVVTEEEAKGKWCPFARTVERFTDGVTGARNRVANIEGDAGEVFAAGLIGTSCIGSACMAWQWEPLLTSPEWVAAVKKAAETLGDKSPSKNAAAAHVNSHRADYGLPDKPFRGWCGLAGRP